MHGEAACRRCCFRTYEAGAYIDPNHRHVIDPPFRHKVIIAPFSWSQLRLFLSFMPFRNYVRLSHPFDLVHFSVLVLLMRPMCKNSVHLLFRCTSCFSCFYFGFFFISKLFFSFCILKFFQKFFLFGFQFSFKSSFFFCKFSRNFCFLISFEFFIFRLKSFIKLFFFCKQLRSLLFLFGILFLKCLTGRWRYFTKIFNEIIVMVLFQF